MNIGKLYDSPYVRATIPYRMIGGIIADTMKKEYLWINYKNAVISLCDMIVAYSHDKETCDRCISYLEKVLDIETSSEFIEWGQPFYKFYKEFSQTEYELLEDFCKEAMDKLFKEE